MENLVIIGIATTGLCLLLLVFVSVQMHGVRNDLAELEAELRRSRSGPAQGTPVEPVGAVLVNLLEQVRRVDVAVEVLRTQIGRMANTPASDRPAPAAKPAPVVADVRPSSAAERGTSGHDLAAVPDRPQHRDSAPTVRPVAFPDAVPPPQVGGSQSDKLLDEYRALIAQPRKADINRWIDERSGESIEATDDGSFQPLGRDSGGLLVLLAVDDQSALILPGGRLVVDFATSFANAISMRSVTRQAFELTNDGSGVLRLVEPALAERRDGIWRLARPGRLAGLKPD